ncbi:MAG: AMP-binding protein [Carboxylicivirga sp.]|jgi:acyl-CoA synthetase (AMP-forming)/AMP-acid ligase II|nr:AMP-binding protein [Carboxylicivirga sp.]
MTPIPQRLLGEALLKTAASHPDKEAILIKDRQYTYQQLLTASLKMARHLLDNGLQKGQRVALYMNNNWECIVSLYGTTLAGGVFLVINPQTKADKLLYILNDCGASVLITEAPSAREFNGILDKVEKLEQLVVVGQQQNINDVEVSKVSTFDQVQSGDTILPEQLPLIIPNDLAALIYTSGSTGFPKGVMMTHQSMVFASWSLTQYLRLTEDDRIIVLSPFAFDYGLYQLLMTVTVKGSLIVEQSFTFQSTIYKLIDKYQPTIFPGVPTIYAMMISSWKKKPFSLGCIKKITNTAAALPASSLPQLKEIFPNALIFKMYGLTECKRVCYLEPELLDEKPGSVGKAMPGTEVFLLSPDGKRVENGGSGILHIRGPHVMLGYWNKPDLSNQMLIDGELPYERVLCSNDWFRTDDEGFLYFLGRNDDIIKTRGEKVSPIEIENIIHKVQGIREAAVFGIPDKILGEAIVAYVTCNGDAPNEKGIQQICASKLESFMVPQKIFFIDEMPKSTNGKIDKKELKKMNHESV